ncbi:MAG: hypothetical protein WB729_21915 [Candidatus Sulfotelmatobacter sp.]
MVKREHHGGRAALQRRVELKKNNRALAPDTGSKITAKLPFTVKAQPTPGKTPPEMQCAAPSAAPQPS